MEIANNIAGNRKYDFGHGNGKIDREDAIMAQKFTDMSETDLEYFMKRLVDRIEMYLGEPHNPDDMLDEGREIYASFKEKEEILFDVSHDSHHEELGEDRTFEALLEALSMMKRFVTDFSGEKWLTTLAVPSRMPRTRPRVRETARAIVSAWNENSADPELVDVVPAAEKLIAAFDEFVTAFEAQEDYKAKVASAYREKKESRKRVEKYIRRVKTQISLTLDPYDFEWERYGFEPRKRRAKKVEEE